MKRVFAVFLLLACAGLYSDDTPAQPNAELELPQNQLAIPSVDCTQIFAQRKDEILKQLDQIEQQRQILQAYKAQIDTAYQKSLAELQEKQKKLDATNSEISAKKDEIAKLKQENEKILAELKSMTIDKVAQSYAKMKDQAAADVLSDMDLKSAASILYALEPKKIAAIMAKMQAQKASELTVLLQSGPPFERDKTPPQGSLIN